MRLRDIVQESTFRFIHTVSEDSFKSLDYFLNYNFATTSLFDSIGVAYNTCNKNLNQDFIRSLDKFVPNVEIFYKSVNNLHMFGTIDLDEACLVEAKTLGVKYLWKCTNDFLVGPAILDVEVPEDFDFAYLPGFSLETLEQASGRTENYEKFNFVPQTNFFIINVNAVDNLYGNDIEEKKSQYEAVKKLHPYIKPWDMQFSDGVKFACEDHLARTTANLKKHCLLSPVTLNNLIDFVRVNKVADPSHKNIYFTQTQLCHYHNAGGGVYNVD